MIIPPGIDSLDLFKDAYLNRYTWDPDFTGYKGSCDWRKGSDYREGTFEVSPETQPIISGIKNDDIYNAIKTQLFDVAIHRVRRSFKQIHGDNNFRSGDTTDEGTKVIVGGKNKHDYYRVKNNIITEVHRHIHGKIIVIHTQTIFDTGSGYLSQSYSSQFYDPLTHQIISPKNKFIDNYILLFQSNVWVLSKRVIVSEAFSGEPSLKQEFNFTNLNKID